MKKVFIVILCFFATISVYSQIDFGVKVVSDVKHDAFPIRHLSFGPSLDVHIPIIGVGLSTSVLFTSRYLYHKENNVLDKNYEFFVIPLNFKWKLGFNAINLYFAAGPYAMVPFGTKLKTELNLISHSRSCIYGLNGEFGIGFLSKYRVCVGYKVDVIARDLEDYYHKENSLYLSFFYSLF